MAVSAKAISLAAELVDDLTRRGYTCTQAVSTVSGFEGSPVITVGTPGTNNQSCVFRVCQLNPLSTDALGLAITGFSPTIIQLGLEKQGSNYLSVLAMNALGLDLMGVLLSRGTILELYMETNAAGLAEADLVSAKLVKTWYSDLKYKQMDAQ